MSLLTHPVRHKPTLADRLRRKARVAVLERLNEQEELEAVSSFPEEILDSLEELQASHGDMT